MDVIEQPGVYVTAGRDAEELRDGLKNAGWVVVTLSSDIIDKASFFEAVSAACPLDPPLMRVQLVWDALEDSLWGGLDGGEADKVAVLWPQSRSMKLQSPGDFSTAIDVMASLTVSLADSELTRGEPTQVAFVLI